MPKYFYLNYNVKCCNSVAMKYCTLKNQNHHVALGKCLGNSSTSDIRKSNMTSKLKVSLYTGILFVLIFIYFYFYFD